MPLGNPDRRQPPLNVWVMAIALALASAIGAGAGMLWLNSDWFGHEPETETVTVDSPDA
ncbi:hypothetical protein [Aurantiacibacter spongiae]|uniref:hypothetical protein n=1 Tax=Aurantiacibacter spongiae TaxID=2488860 RepID=UPI00131564F7|nr:hypothetical protein [Aurantiacibacter spongiae]